MNKNDFPFPIIIINMDHQLERYNSVKTQLDTMDIKNYSRFSATNGSKTAFDKKHISYNLTLTPNQAGCADSHIRVWEHIRDNNMGWTLILEDDVVFHPNFKELFNYYWSKVPANAKIVYLGYGHEDPFPNRTFPIIQKDVYCLHAYMINAKTAQYLLKNLVPMRIAIDLEVMFFMGTVRGSYICNDKVNINGIIPYDYKVQNCKTCYFNGIVYQNRDDYVSNIEKERVI